MRSIRRLVILAAVASVAYTGRAASEDRVYEQDGVTYRETRNRVRRPVSETRYQERDEVFYREKYTTEMRDVAQTVATPVTQYVWEARWHGWWNPFQEPYVAYHLVPYTSWSTRQQSVRLPVTRREFFPEKRTVRVPVTTLRMVEEDRITRVAVNPPRQLQSLAPAGAATPIAAPIGGIARMEGDPPRRGTGGAVRR
jgi:hypothetical protein